jgi:hypothetical protein
MSGRTLLLAALCVGLAGAYSGSEAAKKVHFLEPKRGPPEPDVAQLVDAENAFCKLALSAGIRDAFYENLAENGIIFRPGPMNGKNSSRTAHQRRAPVDWGSELCGISASGDMGWTTGPWSSTRKGRAVDSSLRDRGRSRPTAKRALIDRGHEHPVGRPVHVRAPGRR